MTYVPPVGKKKWNPVVLAVIGGVIVVGLFVYLYLNVLLIDFGEPSDALNTFHITFPSGWNVERHTGGATVMAFSPPSHGDDDFAENISVIVHKMSRAITQKDLEDGCEGASMGFSDVRLIDKGVVLLDSRPAAYYLIDFTLEGRLFRTKQYMTAKGNLFFVITCTANPGSYDDYSEQFEPAVETFRAR